MKHVKPSPEKTLGSREERAAWMRQASGLFNTTKIAAAQDGLGDEKADRVARAAYDFHRKFGHARAKRTAKAPGGVGRR